MILDSAPAPSASASDDGGNDDLASADANVCANLDAGSVAVRSRATSVDSMPPPAPPRRKRVARWLREPGHMSPPTSDDDADGSCSNMGAHVEKAAVEAGPTASAGAELATALEDALEMRIVRVRGTDIGGGG